MNIENPVTVLSIFDTSKIDRNKFVCKLIESVESGDINPLKLHIYLKSVEDIINRITVTDEKRNRDNYQQAELFKKELLEESEKFGKNFEYHNSKVSIREVGVKYDFSNCNDQVLNELLRVRQEIDSKIKERETFLKNIPISGVDIINEETGEAYKVYPPSKSSTTSVTVTLK